MHIYIYIYELFSHAELPLTERIALEDALRPVGATRLRGIFGAFYNNIK